MNRGIGVTPRARLPSPLMGKAMVDGSDPGWSDRSGGPGFGPRPIIGPTIEAPGRSRMFRKATHSLGSRRTTSRGRASSTSRTLGLEVTEENGILTLHLGGGGTSRRLPKAEP